MYAIDSNALRSDDISILFRKPKPMLSTTELLDEIERKLELGLIEEHEKFQILDPNMDDDDARDKLERIEAAQPKLVLPVIPPGIVDADNEEQV